MKRLTLHVRAAQTIFAAAAFVAIASAFALAVAPAALAQSQSKRAMTFDDLISLHRVAEPAISPDGQWIAFTVATPDREANRNASNIWRVSTTGGESTQLTRSGHDSSPAWTPDGKHLAFLSARDGESDIYTMPADGGEATRLTHVSTDIDLFRFSPDGKSIAFSSAVFPDCKDDACNKSRLDAAEKSKVKARIYDHLLFRHWTQWSDGRRGHLFIVAADGASPRDLTPGANYDVPPFQRGDLQDIVFSPDGRELCFVAVTDAMEATSTNGDLFLVPADGSSAPKRITINPGFDSHPAYSPDGKSIAYRAQTTPGYESDRWRLMLYDRASARISSLAADFDRSVDGIVWSNDSRTIFSDGEDRHESPIWAFDVAAASQPSYKPRVIAGDAFNTELSLSADGKTLIFTRPSLLHPAEIYSAEVATGASHAVTHLNDASLAQLDMSTPEWFWFPGAGGTQVEGVVIRPTAFDASKKYPVVLVIHGGPQNAWDDSWTFRWNAELFAAKGYVIIGINPRGSSSYGQKFTDEIQNDWGGKSYEDLMKGLDFALAKYPFMDAKRTAAAGGSYGGYMVDWISTQTGRFKALISHAGPYNMVSMYATEELWFQEHETEGTPWSNPENYKKWSPSTYAAQLGKFKTPTLVIGGEMDFRIPYTQELEYFSALQRQGVPSKLLLFPDEGHWILKPQNSELWYKTFFDWLATYVK
jgi:dipeptidyl aminopeptidase/acylaminoacyl peptidase